MTRVIFRFLWEWVVGDDLLPLRRAADEVIGGRSQAFDGFLFQQAFQFSAGQSITLEDEIAALEEGFCISESQFSEEIAQIGHSDSVMAADIDPAQKCYVGGHERILFASSESMRVSFMDDLGSGLLFSLLARRSGRRSLSATISFKVTAIRPRKKDLPHLITRQKEKREDLTPFHGAFAEALLPVLDNLQRALHAAKQANDQESLMKRVALVQSQMLASPKIC
jgi:GrpE